MRRPNRIREIRNSRGFTLKDLADRSGIFFTQIAKIETGERPAKDFEFRRLGEALNARPADLFLESERGLSEGERSVIDRLRLADEPIRRAVLALLATTDE